MSPTLLIAHHTIETRGEGEQWEDEGGLTLLDDLQLTGRRTEGEDETGGAAGLLWIGLCYEGKAPTDSLSDREPGRGRSGNLHSELLRIARIGDRLTSSRHGEEDARLTEVEDRVARLLSH